MLFKKLIKMTVLQMSVLLLAAAFVMVVGACTPESSDSGEGDPNVPVAGDFDVGNLTQEADAIKAVTITPKSGKSNGAITIYYNGNTALPTAAGSYSVTFDVAADGDWKAATKLYAGLLTIGSVEQSINYATTLNWGTQSLASVNTLTLQPGKDTTEININWYSTGTTANKVAQVRFIRGTLTAGKQLIEENGIIISVAGAGATANNTAHKATVSGLIPGASYQYAVSSDGTNWSKEYDYKVPATGAFKFAVIADPQLHNTSWDTFNRYQPTASTIATTGSKTEQGWIETVQKIVTAGVSFIASGGDQVDTSTTIAETEYNSFFAPPGLRNLPFAPVSGNHDRNLGFNYHYNWPGQDQRITSETLTDNVNAGRNYYYLYNNILFVVLDTAPYPGQTDGSPTQSYPFIDKFKATIQAAKSVNAGKYDWLIVQHHKSTASVAVHLADRDIQSYVEAGFEKLMSDENVDFVLAGHDHVYARSYPLMGKDGGQVSAPDKSTTSADTHTVTAIQGKPIYLTFTTGSGLKYYSVFVDKQFAYANANPKLYVSDNTAYPYLGTLDTTTFLTDKKGSNDWLDGYTPVSNAAWVQPYIPSYCIAEVNGKTIKFSTYAITTKTGRSEGATEDYSFDETKPYDWVEVSKN